MSQEAKGTTTLIIEHDLVGSWVMCNNRFTKKKEDKAKRSGVLFQLGDFTTNVGTPPFGFEEVILEFQEPGRKPKNFKKENFTWINIVSRFDGGGVPMKREHAFSLYPSNREERKDPCAGLNVPPDKKHCLRNRKIHWDQKKVSNIITYWAGMNGFRLEAQQVDPDKPGNTFTFTFEDQCKVSVYKEVEVLGERKMRLLEDYKWDEVVSVKVCVPKPVLVKKNGRTDGAQQDPPWEPPPPDDGDTIQGRKKARRTKVSLSPAGTAGGC